MSRFVDCSQFDQTKAKFEFDLIKILSSLIVNARRIFIKTVVKKSRDNVQFKSDSCLIKILSSLIVNAKRILFNSKWKFDQVVYFKKSVKDKKKRILFERKVFFLSRSAKIKNVKIRKQDLIKNDLRMFQSTMKFV
jgi:hypothetical protein